MTTKKAGTTANGNGNSRFLWDDNKKGNGNSYDNCKR
jgi:hypothetical protein